MRNFRGKLHTGEVSGCRYPEVKMIDVKSEYATTETIIVGKR